MIFVNVLVCLKTLMVLNKHFEDQIELPEEKRHPIAKEFFNAKDFIMSFLIDKIALTLAFKVEAPDELENALNYIQHLHSDIFSKKPEVYYILYCGTTYLK